MNNFLNNEKGIALIMVIILLVAVGSLVGVLMTSEVFNISFASREVDETKAFYLAEAGVQRIEYLINEYGREIFEGDYSALNSEEINFLEFKEMSINSYENGNYQIKDNSISVINNIIELDIIGEYKGSLETISLTIEIKKLPSAFNSALFSGSEGNSTIELSGGASIEGEIITNSSFYDAFNLKGGSNLNGNIYINQEELLNPPENTWEANNSYEKGTSVWYEGMKYIKNNGGYGGSPYSNSIGLYDSWIRVVPKFHKDDQLLFTEELTYLPAEFPDFTNQADNDYDISTSTQSNITGRIIDNNNNGLENVKLYLNTQRNNNNAAAESQNWGSIGNFTLYSVKGTVTITPVKDNYIFEPKSIEVTHPSDEIIFKAIPAPGKTYDENNIKTSESTEYKIKGGEEYDQIEIANEVPLVIDMEEGDKTITVNKLNIKGDMELINVAEDSHLSINVTDEFNLNGSGRLNPFGEINNVTVFYQGTNDINIAGGTELIGNLFIDKADLTFTAGSSIKGHVISNGNNITISGGSDVNTRVIYAPNSKVTLKGGGNVKGSVIANSFKASGGTKLIYDESKFISEILFELLNISDPAENSSVNDINIIWYRK